MNENSLPRDVLERALVVAEEAAREAGDILLGHFGKLDPARIGTKTSARDLVTVADVESERSLVRRLRAAFPEHAIEAEEEVRDEADGRPRWFLDPLDGTVNFVHGLPAFCVSMGLFWRGVPQAAVVYAPRLGECFRARRGGGAQLDGRPIHVSNARTLSDAILGTGFPYRRGPGFPDNLANVNRLYPRIRDLRRMGSAALDLACVAAGRLDGYWELQLAPHDVAAGALLVREAGGRVVDVKGGDDWLRAGHVIAANAEIAAEILAIARVD